MSLDSNKYIAFMHVATYYKLNLISYFKSFYEGRKQYIVAII